LAFPAGMPIYFKTKQKYFVSTIGMTPCGCAWL
jgi:hypothetical protein